MSIANGRNIVKWCCGS